MDLPLVQAARSTGLSAVTLQRLIRDEPGIPRVDVVIGGPPCQGFVAVGRAKIVSLSPERRQRFEARNWLYRRFLSRLQEHCC
jgi:site-specific DNA-cytosine methylase